MKKQEHVFILGHKETFDELSQEYENIVLEQSWNLATINRHDIDGAILVIHGLFLSSGEICCLKLNSLQYIVWYVWRHGLYCESRKETLLIRCKNWRVNHKVGCFRAIAAGFKYDKCEIWRRLGRGVPIHNALYNSGYFSDDVDNIICEHQRVDTRTNIMIGHSSYPFLQHEKQLKNLACYKNENIVIILILCYGNKDYSNRIIKYAPDIFGPEKSNIVCDFINRKAYIKLLCDLDIAIFYFEYQAYLGNLLLLPGLGQKIYLSPTGIMYRAFGKADECIQSFDIGLKSKSLGCSVLPSVYAKSLLNRKKTWG